MVLTGPRGRPRLRAIDRAVTELSTVRPGDKKADGALPFSPMNPDVPHNSDSKRSKESPALHLFAILGVTELLSASEVQLGLLAMVHGRAKEQSAFLFETYVLLQFKMK